MYPELMDPDQNLFVLPSNASTNLDHHSSPRGVLQNTSGNVQSNTLENGEVIPDTVAYDGEGYMWKIIPRPAQRQAVKQRLPLTAQGAFANTVQTTLY
jgi:hypothetical protein